MACSELATAAAAQRVAARAVFRHALRAARAWTLPLGSSHPIDGTAGCGGTDLEAAAVRQQAREAFADGARDNPLPADADTGASTASAADEADQRRAIDAAATAITAAAAQLEMCVHYRNPYPRLAHLPGGGAEGISHYRKPPPPTGAGVRRRINVNGATKWFGDN